jgi:hypothetical protein
MSDRLRIAIIIVAIVILVAVALAARPSAPEASFVVLLEPDWKGRWETGVPGVKFIPLAVTAPESVKVSFARDIRGNPAIAEEVIRRLGLESKMTKGELLENLTVEPDSADGIRLTYRDPARGTPQRARKIVRTVAVVAAERIRKEIPCRCAYDYTWGLAQRAGYFVGSTGPRRGYYRDVP